MTLSGLTERVAQLLAHRACTGAEHDASQGKLHGMCVVCGVAWPCFYAGAPPSELERESCPNCREPLSEDSLAGGRCMACGMMLVASLPLEAVAGQAICETEQHRKRAEHYEDAYGRERARTIDLVMHLEAIAGLGCENTTDDDLGLQCVERGDTEDLCTPCIASWALLTEAERARYLAVHAEMSRKPDRCAKCGKLSGSSMTIANTTVCTTCLIQWVEANVEPGPPATDAPPAVDGAVEFEPEEPYEKEWG